MPTALTALAEQTAARKPQVYCENYALYFERLRDQPLKLLELGVDQGGSLEMWAQYFPRATICGLDWKEPAPIFSTDRIRYVRALQDDAEVLIRLSAEAAPEGWDVIIDDCSHEGIPTLRSFQTLFPRLKVGGFYSVEDWATGYVDAWPDGKAFDTSAHFTTRDGAIPSHQVGMTGFVKQLVDEMAMGAICDAGGARRGTLFEYVHYWRGFVMMRKQMTCSTVHA